MAITISGENNNDRILASDGVIDQLSGFNVVGVITATSFTGDLTGDVTGNLTGNVTGNINNTTLLLQTGGSERVRISSGGDVTIGNSMVAFPSGGGLQVYNASAARIKLANSTTGVASGDGFQIYVSGSSAILDQKENAEMRFYTNATERLRIDNNGKVLIATDTTSEAAANNDELIIGKTTDNANHGLTIVTPSNRYGTVAFSDGSGGTSRGLLEYNHSSDFFRIYVAASERLRISSNGNALFTTNQVKLYNATDNSNTYFYAQNTGPGNAGVSMKNQDGEWTIIANDSLRFRDEDASVDRLRIESNGFITNAFKPVKTAQNTVVTDTVGDRFQIGLPNTSRMYRITGSFNFDGSGTGTIWGDFGDWSDGHGSTLEGFANVWRDGAGGPQYQDYISGRYFRVATPFDYASLEVTYDVLITTVAFNGGARPGIHGHIRWTWNGIGNALTVFSYQDTSANGTERLNSFAWDIDGASGNMGTGRHHYVIEQYPLT